MRVFPPDSSGDTDTVHCTGPLDKQLAYVTNKQTSHCDSRLGDIMI